MSFLALIARAMPYLEIASRLPLEELLIVRRTAINIKETTISTKEAPPEEKFAMVKSPAMGPIPPVNLINGEPFPPKEETVSGVSQISAAGKACIPCGNDHFSTASSMLEEALRFAREERPLGEGGIYHPEVTRRIFIAEDELNAFERGDGAAEKMARLPQDEMELMYEMLKASRRMRHMLKEIVDVPSLVSTTAEVGRIKMEFRTRVFDMQLNKLPEKTRDIIKRTARELVESVGKEGEDG